MGKWWYTTSDGRRRRTKEGLRHEYDTFQSSEEDKKDRASRNNARRAAIRSGKVRVGDNKDIHHTQSVRDNSHTIVLPSSVNRGKREKSRKRGSRRR